MIWMAPGGWRKAESISGVKVGSDVGRRGEFRSQRSAEIASYLDRKKIMSISEDGKFAPVSCKSAKHLRNLLKR